MLPLRARAQGRWFTILPQLGVPPAFLTGKHTACPICRAGKDRFRYDNQEGRGTWICSVCGAGDGISLVMKLNGWSFARAANRIEALIGTATSVEPRPRRSEQDKRAVIDRLWAAAKPVQADDPVGCYLRARIGLREFPPCLRFLEKARYATEPPSFHPAMIAAVQAPDGRLVSLHRTYLAWCGRKADVENPRRMIGLMPKGSAVRLFDVGGVLGIAEGIETALASASIYGLPCWAALNAALLAGWNPPQGVEEVVVFGDNDASFAGQAAAYALARSLKGRSIRTSVEIPQEIGTDWNDVLLRNRTPGNLPDGCSITGRA
jgi:putative DNA primase/helicase